MVGTANPKIHYPGTLIKLIVSVKIYILQTIGNCSLFASDKWLEICVDAELFETF